VGSWGFHHSFELFGGRGALGSRSLFRSYWAWCLLVVRDVPEFPKVEGVPGAFALGIHCVFFVATSGVDGETQSSFKILPRLLGSGSTGNVGLGLRSQRSYSHFRPTQTSGAFTRLAWARCSRGTRHVQHGLFAALLKSLAWARCSCGIRHARCGLFAALLTPLAWACSSRGIRHVQRGLFAAVVTRLAWGRCSHGIRHARHGHFAALLTRVAWARCSRGIRHTRRGLFAAFLTRLAWARCSGEGWSQRRSRG